MELTEYETVHKTNAGLFLLVTLSLQNIKSSISAVIGTTEFNIKWGIYASLYKFSCLKDRREVECSS